MTWHYSQGTPHPDWRSLPRPHTWKFSDPFDHVRHNAWLKMKSQALFRKEEWELSVEDFFAIWHSQELWEQRGKTKASLCATRIDPEKPWSKDNIELLTRTESCRLNNKRSRS